MTFQNIGYMPIGGGVPSTDSTYFDSNYADYAVSIRGTGETSIPLNTNKEEAWFHFNVTTNSGPDSFSHQEMLEVVDNQGNKIMRIQYSSGTATVYYNTGAGDVSIGTISFLGSKAFNQFDAHIKIDGTVGIIRVYLNGSLINEFTGDTVGSLTGRLINKITLRTYRNTTTTGLTFHYSEFCIAYDGDSTLNKRIYNKAPTANGAETSWEGDYTSVNGTTSKAGIESDTAAQAETYTFPALPGSGAVQVMAIGAIGASGGGIDYDHAVRVGTTNYEQAPTPAVDGVSHFRESIWTTNPATTDGLTVSDINAMEFGFVSDTIT